MTDAAPPPLTITAGEAETCLTLAAEAGLDAAAALREGLASALQRGVPVRVDCSALDFVDTAVAQLLLAVRAEGRRRGVPCHIEGITPPASEYLQRADLEHHLLADSLPDPR